MSGHCAQLRHRALAEFMLFFTSPLVLILLLAAVVSGVVGELLNAGLIVVMVLLSVALFPQAAARPLRSW